MSATRSVVCGRAPRGPGAHAVLQILELERARAHEHDDTAIVLCTGLSQTANTDRSRDGFYRPRDFDVLTERLALPGVKATSPVMAEQGHIFFADADAAAQGEATLAAVRSGGEPAFAV